MGEIARGPGGDEFVLANSGPGGWNGGCNVLTVRQIDLTIRPLWRPGTGASMDRSAIQRPLAVMMSRRILTVSVSAPVIEAARILCEAKIGALLVSGEDGRYVGILSETDLVRKVLAVERDPSRVLVSEVMMAPIITIEIDRSAHDASDLMAERAIRHLAVTEDGHIVGMLSVRDLLRYFKNWGRL